jgi:hypothetical protein
MDDHQYTDFLILQSGELTEHTPFCPKEGEIAEYFDGVLSKSEQVRLERHLVDCHYCLAHLGMLGRLDVLAPDRRIPGDVLATAKAMVHRQPGRLQRLAPAWAVAALLVLAVGVLPQLHYTGQIGPESVNSPILPEHTGNLRETRSALSPKTELSFLSPARGMAIIPENYLFRWTPVPNSRFYQVRIVSDDGDLLWQERITGTEWKLPALTHLTPSAEYFIRVEAFLADTRSVKSDYHLFQVEENR